jgi:hypothetical protein
MSSYGSERRGDGDYVSCGSYDEMSSKERTHVYRFNLCVDLRPFALGGGYRTEVPSPRQPYSSALIYLSHEPSLDPVLPVIPGREIETHFFLTIALLTSLHSSLSSLILSDARSYALFRSFCATTPLSLASSSRRKEMSLSRGDTSWE